MNTPNVIRPVSKGFYLGMYIGGSMLAMILMVIGFIAIGASAAAAEEGAIQEEASMAIAGVGALIIMAAVVVSLAAAAVQFVLYYKMWASIQDGCARTTPGKAVGFMFIPFFNIYWMFQAIWGFSKDYNAFLQRHSIQAKPLSENLFLWACIVPLLGMVPLVGWLSSIASIVLYIMVIIAACDAINGLVYSHGQAQPVPEPGVDEILRQSPIQYPET